MAAHSNKGRSRETSPEEQLHQDIMAAADRCRLHDYIRFIRPLLEASSRAPWTSVSLATAIHRLGRCEGSIHEEQDLPGFFDLLAQRLKAMKDPFGDQSASGAFYGLHAVVVDRLKPDEFTALARLLKQLVDEAKRCRQEFKSQGVGMAFYGLRGVGTAGMNDVDREVVADALATLAQKTRSCSESLYAQHVGMAFYGLHNIRTADLSESGKNALARALMELTRKLDTCREDLNSQVVGEVLYGLKNIDTSTFNDKGCRAIRLVLESLANKIQASTQWFRSDDIESAIETLAEISSGDLDESLREAVLNLLVVLTEKLKTRTEGIRLETVAKAISSLRGCGSASLPSHLRARLATVLGNVADACDRCLSLRLNAETISNAFYGLQGMDTACLDELGRRALVRLIKVLTEKTRECKEVFDAKAVGMCFFGLQGIDIAALDDHGRNAICEALKALAEKAGVGKEPLNMLGVENVFVGLRGFLADAPHVVACRSTEAVHAQALDAAMIVLRKMTAGEAGYAAEAHNLAFTLQVLHHINAPELNASKQDLLERLDKFWARQRQLTDDTRADKHYLSALLESQQAYSLYGRPLPMGLADCLASYAAESDRVSSPSPHDKETQWELEGILNVPVQLNQIVDGFRLSASFILDGRLYNVESERAAHLRQRQRLSNRQRDTFLRSKGYEIIRVLPGISPQRIAEHVLEHVTSRPQTAAVVSQHAPASR